MNGAPDFKEYKNNFSRLLHAIDIETISAEPYCKKYLSHLIQHLPYYLAIYEDVLQRVQANCKQPVDQLKIVDIGAGNGLLGLFARYCGFEQVYINDTDKKFIDASVQLALQLNIAIDGFITGDIAAVEAVMQHIKPDAFIGTDVIEHIYDLHEFFETICRINPLACTVFTTASNPENYFKIRQLKKLQLRDEFEGGSPDDFLLFGEKAHEPFFKIRRQIVYRELEQKDENTAQQLATLTRGLHEADITRLVHAFNRTGNLPAAATHPTNTCNPLTGSWTERILSIEAYKSIYQKHGMRLSVGNGFYNSYKPGIKGIINKILNFAVRSTGSYFAPYIILTGSKN